MIQLTPQILREKGFTYTSPGISGADSWQGVAFWDHKEKGLHLRGNISTSKGGYLQIPGQMLSIDSVEDLDMILSLCK